MEPINVVYDICRSYMIDLQGEVSPSLFSKVDGFRRSRNLEGLSTCSSLFDWQSMTVRDWRFLRQVEAFFKKNALFADEQVCREAARIAFFEGEKQCQETNVRLETSEDFRNEITKMQSYISRVLGEYRPFLDKVPELLRVTPGATASHSRRNSLPQLKLKLKVYSTPLSEALIRTLYTFLGFKRVRVMPTKTNRVELVPKNWKTSRTIACEPEGVLPFQLAFDSYAKKRLRFFGIDLSDQSANQRLACEASLSDEYATVDFKAASDTVSYEVVRLLFPKEWLNFLVMVRSPRYRGVFGEGQYEKFSSMGNGTTFAIETLIFAAACYAVGSKRFLVYGDDVIIESSLFGAYQELTRHLGFTINTSKSFVQGPFRESCGVEVFSGIDVTPLYIRGIDTRKACLCHLVNTMGQISVPGGELESLLQRLIIAERLPFTPVSQDSLAGVWIDPVRARRLGVLRTRHGSDFARSYTAKSKVRTFVDSRGYYLWFLMKRACVLFGGPWMERRNITSTQTSSVAIFDHTYVRKWVHWFPPVKATAFIPHWESATVTAANGRRPA